MSWRFTFPRVAKVGLIQSFLVLVYLRLSSCSFPQTSCILSKNINKIGTTKMRLSNSLILFVFLFSSFFSVQAQDDPFDLSELTNRTSGLGISTIAQVTELEERGRELYNAGNCSEAVDVLDEFARRSNWLANIIREGLEPFYDAGRDERAEFDNVRSLIPFEELANSYTRKRNIAMVMRAECLANLGDTEQALHLFFRALGLIDIENTEWWGKARSGLYEIVGVSH